MQEQYKQSHWRKQIQIKKKKEKWKSTFEEENWRTNKENTEMRREEMRKKIYTKKLKEKENIMKGQYKRANKN